jgi:hypothetical protein
MSAVLCGAPDKSRAAASSSHNAPDLPRLEQFGQLVECCLDLLGAAKQDAARLTKTLSDLAAAMTEAKQSLTATPDLHIFHDHPGQSSTEPANTFKLVGEFWSVSFGEESGLLKNSKGLQHIAYLLRHLGEPIPALQLMDRVGTSEAQVWSSRRPNAEAEIATEGRSQQVRIEEEGRNDIQKRKTVLASLIEQARNENSQARVEELEEEFHRLADEEKKARSYHGRLREIGPTSPAEKARIAVRKNIDRALERMQEVNPPLNALAAHLKKQIKTEGTAYVYLPARNITPWEL